MHPVISVCNIVFSGITVKTYSICKCIHSTASHRIKLCLLYDSFRITFCLYIWKHNCRRFQRQNRINIFSRSHTDLKRKIQKSCHTKHFRQRLRRKVHMLRVKSAKVISCTFRHLYELWVLHCNINTITRNIFFTEF